MCSIINNIRDDMSQVKWDGWSIYNINQPPNMKLSSFHNTTDIYDEIIDKNCGNVENKET